MAFNEMSDVTRFVEFNGEAMLREMLARGGFNQRNADLAKEWIRQKEEYMRRQAQAERDAHQRALEEEQRNLTIRAVAAAERAADAAAEQATAARDSARHARMAWIVAAIAAAISLATSWNKIWDFIHKFL